MVYRICGGWAALACVGFAITLAQTPGGFAHCSHVAHSEGRAQPPFSRVFRRGVPVQDSQVRPTSRLQVTHPWPSRSLRLALLHHSRLQLQIPRPGRRSLALPPLHSPSPLSPEVKVGWQEGSETLQVNMRFQIIHLHAQYPTNLRARVVSMCMVWLVMWVGPCSHGTKCKGRTVTPT